MNVLYLYYHLSRFNWHQTIIDNFKCFERYSPHRIHYCNIGYGVPRYVAKKPYDLIFLHTSIPSLLRWTDISFQEFRRKVGAVIDHPAPKVLFCQDEFFKMGLVVKLIDMMKIDHVFSVAPEDQWEAIYKGVDRQKVSIHSVLTGYLDPMMVEKVKNTPQPPRDIDIGYRACHVPEWLGSHGRLKVDIASAAENAARKKGLVTDIKLAKTQSDYIHGFDWYRFLLRCKGVVGVEGGSSILDSDGTLVNRVESYAREHPDASYSEIENACFKGMDGNLRLFALSPRHLEACMTRTCQILVEGEYNGILKPHVHYIPLKKDFSNIDEALATLSDEKKRQQIVDNAYRDIVATEKYTYRGFVNHVFDCLPSSNSPEMSCRYINLRDKFLKFRMRCEHGIAHRLPERMRKKLKKLVRG